MEKKYLVGASLCLVLVFSLGLTAGLMIARHNGFDYAGNLNFDSRGFEMSLDKELTGRIKEIKESSLVLNFNNPKEETLRVRKGIDKEIMVNDQTKVWLKRAKTDEDRYGVEAMKKIASLEEQKKKLSPRADGNKYNKLVQQIAVIKKSATDAWSAKMKDLSAQIEVLAPGETARLAELNQQLQALAVNYTLTLIKLSDLQVGELVTVRNDKDLDLKNDLLAENLVVSR